jgi:hypothetical protein
MIHPNRWSKRKAGSPNGSNAVTPKASTYDRYRGLERDILKNLAAPRAAYSYASLLAQIDPARTGEGATILNGSIACGHVSRGESKVRITERGRSALQSLALETKRRRLPKEKG